MPVSVYKSISDNPDEKRSIEEQGVTFVTTDIDNRTKSALLNAVVSVLMNNEEQGKINSENIIDNAKANAGEILGRTSGILSSVVNSFSSGAVVFMIVVSYTALRGQDRRLSYFFSYCRLLSTLA